MNHFIFSVFLAVSVFIFGIMGAIIPIVCCGSVFVLAKIEEEKGLLVAVLYGLIASVIGVFLAFL